MIRSTPIQLLFQSPCGEMVVKDYRTGDVITNCSAVVSVPLRGNGRESTTSPTTCQPATMEFQSPCGEMVVKADLIASFTDAGASGFGPLAGKWS